MSANTALLVRYDTSDKGTFGHIYFKSQIFETLELPDLGNRKSISCIPTGEYLMYLDPSSKWSPPKFKSLYQLHDVPNRTEILIHSGNTIKDTEGCILIGEKRTSFDAITDSREALNAFMGLWNGQTASIRIEDMT